MNIVVYPLRVTSSWFVNYCYLVINTTTNSAILVDPAWKLTKIEQQLKNHQANLMGILLTHHHRDHVHLSEPLARKYNIPVYMSYVEIDYYHFRCKNLISIENFSLFKLKDIEITPLFTPGHTKGGISYLIANNLFSGDTLFIEGCGLCSGKGGDASTMFDTLQMLKKRIPNGTIIYPGHSYGQPVGKPFHYLLKNNIYLCLEDKNDFIDFRMRPNQRNLFNFK
jgi:hydroxyacylglutathione hydrolase